MMWRSTSGACPRPGARSRTSTSCGRAMDPAAMRQPRSDGWGIRQPFRPSRRSSGTTTLCSGPGRSKHWRRFGITDAIGPLIPLLGDAREADGAPVQERVAAALRQLGAGGRVDDRARGARRRFRACSRRTTGAYRAQMVAALEGALEGPSGTHAASALAGIHAVEALPRLREVLRSIGSQEAAGPAVAAAVRRLEARAALPRAASAAEMGRDTLPRSARAPGPDSRTLPRGSRAPSDQDPRNRIDRTPRED